DHLVIATNARVASELVSGLSGASDAAAVLGGVGYYPTQIAIHGDRRWMPANERHWSVVNFRYDGTYGAISVWKPWKTGRGVFRSWISFDKELPDPLYARVKYEHPIGNAAYDRAQQLVKKIQG